ncbi:MAG: SRPBCC family protein [Singulisphaera sp.]
MSISMTPGGVAGRIRDLEETEGKASDVNVGQAERLACAIGGAALLLTGLKKKTPGGIALAVIGGGLAYRAYSGHCDLYEAMSFRTAGKRREGGAVHNGVKVQRSFTIQRSPEECYRFWHDFENLPRFMTHLKSVQKLGENRSRWTANGPLGTTVSWDAEVRTDKPNELIAWRSVEGADINNAGSVRFRPGPNGRGTEVTVELNYEPPAGLIGATIAKLLGEEPEVQVREDLRRFKQILETGEMPTVAGQTSGRVASKA